MEQNFKEQQINELIEQGEKDQAVKLIYEVIVDHAKAKNFSAAEEMREKLIFVYPLALTEIVNSAEIIEAEKSESVDINHRSIWSWFYDRLRDEEVNAFYYSLEQVNIPPDKAIIVQGEVNNNLYFIDYGQLKMICQHDQREFFIKNISAGEIAGHNSFFPITTCTTSTITVTPCQIHSITREAFGKINEKFPGFEEKIQNICLKREKENPSEILKKKMVERRRHGRFGCSGKVTTQIVDESGHVLSGVFAGVIDDISQGGVSYSIKCSKKETARVLLGRYAIIELAITGVENQKVVEKRKGRIVSVNYQVFNDYVIHFKFESPFDAEQYGRLYPFLSSKEIGRQ